MGNEMALINAKLMNRMSNKCWPEANLRSTVQLYTKSSPEITPWPHSKRAALVSDAQIWLWCSALTKLFAYAVV